MIEQLLLNTGINLVVGLALLFFWRSDRAQQFARWLGWSFMAQAISPAAFLAWQHGAAPWGAVGFGALVAAASVSLTLWMVGAADLAGRALARRSIVLGTLAMMLVSGAALDYDPRAAQAVGAVLTAVAAVVALSWLHRLGRYERIAGIAMVLLGLNQFIWVVFGNAGLSVQAGVANVLRVVLGLALLHAAVSRHGGAAGQLRDQSQQLITRSHQGVAVMQGEVMRYANPALLRIYGLPPDQFARIASGKQWRNTTMPEGEHELARERHRRLVGGELIEDHWEGERTGFDGRRLRLRFSA